MTETVCRVEPGIFVRCLSIYRTYPDELLRAIPFNTGLNIVAGGHNSGKTTLYRFLRYLLGDEDYAEKNTRVAIKAKLPDGGLLAQIVINGNHWAVWRPFESKIDSVDSAALISNADEPPFLAPNARGFDKYLAALEDSAREFSTHPSFAGAHPLSWNDLLNLYTRNDNSYSKTMYAWESHALGAQNALPKSTKECWPFLLKLFGMNVAERDAALARLSELEANKQLIEKAEAESQAKYQRDKDYSERLRQDANKELEMIFSTEGHSGLFDPQRRLDECLIALQNNHNGAIKDIQRKAVSLSEVREKLESLKKEQTELKNRELFLSEATKTEERRLHRARETLERIKQRIENKDTCEDGRIFVCKCKEALSVVQKTPEDLIKDHCAMERIEAKDEEEKEKIRARLQELFGEIAAARAQEKGKEDFLEKAENKERKIRISIEKLTSVVNLQVRAKKLEESIQHQVKAEHTDRSGNLEQISKEIETNKDIVQEQNALLTETLNEVNTELTHTTIRFLGSDASAQLKILKANLELILRDGNSGGGKTFNTVVRPLLLDWLTVSYGVAGKSPHHAFLIQDSPFQGEMQSDLQLAYLKMIISLSANWQDAYQQIILTSSSGADGIEASRANIIHLTPGLSGRLLPGVELSRQGFEQIENASEESD